MPRPDPSVSPPPGVPRTTAADLAARATAVLDSLGDRPYTPRTEAREALTDLAHVVHALVAKVEALSAGQPDLAADRDALTVAERRAHAAEWRVAELAGQLRAAEARAKEAEARVAELTKPGPVTEQEIHEAADRSASLSSGPPESSFTHHMVGRGVAAMVTARVRAEQAAKLAEADERMKRALARLDEVASAGIARGRSWESTEWEVAFGATSRDEAFAKHRAAIARAEKAEAEVARLRSSPAAAVVARARREGEGHGFEAGWRARGLAGNPPVSGAMAEAKAEYMGPEQATPDAPRTADDATSDRDRHAAVVEAARAWRTARPAEHAAAVARLTAALDACDAPRLAEPASPPEVATKPAPVAASTGGAAVPAFSAIGWDPGRDGVQFFRFGDGDTRGGGWVTETDGWQIRFGGGAPDIATARRTVEAIHARVTSPRGAADAVRSTEAFIATKRALGYRADCLAVLDELLTVLRANVERGGRASTPVTGANTSAAAGVDPAALARALGDELRRRGVTWSGIGATEQREAMARALATVAAPRVEVLTADALSQAILHNPRGCEPAYDYALKLVRHLGRVAVPSRVVEESVVSPPAPVRAGEEGR